MLRGALRQLGQLFSSSIPLRTGGHPLRTLRQGLPLSPGQRGTVRLLPPTRFLGSLRARLMLLHPSPNCSLRAESLVHVHFKEEIGIAELIPLVTTYIILFAYIYFSTRRSTLGGRGFLPANRGISRSPLPCLFRGPGGDVECA